MLSLPSLITAARAQATQVAFAARLGVAQSTVSAWEQGTSRPPRTRIPTLALALGLSPEKLGSIITRDRRHARQSRKARV